MPEGVKSKQRCLSRTMMFAVLVLPVVVLTYLFATDYEWLATYASQLLFLQTNRTTDIIDNRPLCLPLNVTGYVVSQSQSCKICRGRHVDDGKWFDFSTTSFQFYAYTALYDDRPSMLSNPVIRIVAMSNNANGRKDMKMFCLLYHSFGTVNVSLEGQPKDCGPQVGLQPYVYTCPVPLGVRPLSLTIQGDKEVRACMPVEYPAKPKESRDFAVCVPVAFGNLDPIRLIEWVEMQRILGVSVIGLYDLFISERGRKVLKHYAREGFVDFRKTDAVFPGGGHNVLQSATVLNDCFYRHMYKVKWMIVNDVDEFILPTKNRTLKDLVDHLQKTITYMNSTYSTNFVIRNSYFFFEHQPDSNVSSHLVFLRYRKRAPVSVMWHRVKPIIHTMACTHMYNHLCLGQTANYSKRILVESIDPMIALTHHYRNCPLSPHECKASIANSIADDCMLVFKDVLKRNVEAKIQEILGSVPDNWR